MKELARISRLLASLFACLRSLAACLLPLAPADHLASSRKSGRRWTRFTAAIPMPPFRIARHLQQTQPDHPLGYLLEGEALWWKRYCAACEIKYGMVEAWKRSKEPKTTPISRWPTRKSVAAEAHLAKSETAEMHVYAGMGYALKARVYGLRSENRNVARVAVNGRAEMLRALELDPQMADATAVLGVYNYYVDTLLAS